MKLFYTTVPTNSRAFLERALRDFYGISAPQFSRNEHGKPFLTNTALRFNLSHSGSLTALAVSEQEVGLDVQERSRRAFPALCRRLSPAEHEEDFFTLWTAKEAYIKFKGGALAEMLASLEFKNGVLYEHGKPVDANLFRFSLLSCAACVCAKASEAIEIIAL